jgi:hypothetical protein
MKIPILIAGLVFVASSARAQSFLSPQQQEELSDVTAMAQSSTLGAKELAGCVRDLSKGAAVMLSGGPIDATNPPEVLDRMDAYLDSVNQDAVVQRCSKGKGLAVRMLDGQTTNHIHQSRWQDVCDALVKLDASPIIIAGHSNGGAAGVSLSRCLKAKGKKVDLLLTADSVGTLNDLGPVYAVPSNVGLNVNTFNIPNALTWTVPFPIGKANTSEDSGDKQPIVNIGVGYLLPGAVAHRNAFYDFAGGAQKDDAYTRPYMLLDLTLASLKGADAQAIVQMSKAEAKDWAKAAGIHMTIQSGGVNEDVPR